MMLQRKKSGFNSANYPFNNLTTLVLSSEVFSDGLIVIAKCRGFFLTTVQKERFAFLKKLYNGEMPLGRLVINNAKMKDWYEITHVINNVVIVVGFIRKNGDYIYYNEIMEQPEEKQIIL